jgi:sn-glycerol 3-phosphate transport system substrate-binding protein
LEVSVARRTLSLPVLALLGALLGAFALVSCKGGDNPPPNGETPNGVVNVSLWHSMRAPYDNALQVRFIDAFNQSQTQYHVEATYQGSYSESLNKLIASLGSGQVPTLIQLDDVSTQIMIDSDEITPVQEFIDEDGYDLTDFDPKALSYYQLDGKLYSMPFNLAGPILLYDKEDFADAGLDPETPPQTLDDVRAAAEQLVKRDADGKVTHYGISLQISAWFFEQMLAKQGAFYANNQNGRDGRATEAVFDGPEGQNIITWYQDMVQDGLAYFATDDTDAMLSVVQDKTSMSIGSTAVLGAAVPLIALQGEDPNRLGTGPIPAPAPAAGKEGGALLGGASLWLLGRSSKAEQQGAWEFIKFVSQPEQQAQWYGDTGYFPTRLSAYDLPAAQQRLRDFPQFRTAAEQVRNSPDTPATQGALIGAFNQVRDRIKDAFERALGAGTDPVSALHSAADAATDDMKEYNRTAP